jgi:hypothetical protein
VYFSQASGGRQTSAVQIWDRETSHRNQRPELYDRPRVRSPPHSTPHKTRRASLGEVRRALRGVVHHPPT